MSTQSDCLLADAYARLSMVDRETAFYAGAMFVLAHFASDDVTDAELTTIIRGMLRETSARMQAMGRTAH